MLSSTATRYTLARPLSGVSSRRFRHSGAIERLKNPSRGGRNLSERFLRLEKSLRGKGALLQDLDTPRVIEGEVAACSSSPKQVEMFRGFRIPTKPRMPADDECCMSGCAVCVYDLYEDSLDEYKEKLTALRASLSSSNIPEPEWPEGVRSTSSTGGATKRKDIVLNAFEEMERALKEKRGTDVSAG
ncbi:oxidoreductase-like protein [Collybia nuda]|uniref:Oxidoreductase-like protein n=1 Tax=Collybia nuda TaxID=64659 RepID=A0A9P5XX54_9AGAR|nr:oxidoreductase-like protein [Collybia nuda]